MNYTNNIDKYYIHAHYNSVREKETNRNKVVWLLLLIGILLSGLFFLYKSYQFNEITTAYENSKVEKAKVEKGSMLTVDESKVMPSEEIVLKKEEPIVASVPSSAINSAIEKLEVVESQKLTESTRESVLLDSKIAEKHNKIGSVMSSTALETTQSSNLVATETTKEQATVSSPVISEKEESATKAVVANGADANISKALPTELFHLYVISKGETLYSIALKEYNDRGMYQKIIQANSDLENPNNIHEGQEILLPIVNEAKSYSDILHFR